MVGRDMEAFAIGIEGSVQDEHVRARVGQTRGLRMVYEPTYLRFFQARFEPI